MKDHDKNKETLCFKYYTIYNSHVWTMCQMFPLSGFKWVQEISQFNEDLIKSNNENSSDTEYFLEVDIQYPEELRKYQCNLPFLHERLERLLV